MIEFGRRGSVRRSNRLGQEETIDAPNQALKDLWSIPLNLERRELQLKDWRGYLRE